MRRLDSTLFVSLLAHVLIRVMPDGQSNKLLSTQGRPSRTFQPDGDEVSKLLIGSNMGEHSMKLKLASLLAVIVLGLAGCGNDSNSNSTNSTNSTNKTTNASNKTSSTEQKPDVNTVPAKAEASSEVGGTAEGCKCSADGMKCATKPGDKGCCGAKDGACSSMAEGKADCCKSKGSDGAACCSAAGKMAANDKNATNPGTTKPAASTTASKKG